MWSMPERFRGELLTMQIQLPFIPLTGATVITVKMHLLTLWPWHLTFQPQNHIISRIFPKVIPYTKFEHFGIIHFWVMLRTNRQTNRQMEPNSLPMPTNSVDVGKYRALRKYKPLPCIIQTCHKHSSATLSVNPLTAKCRIYPEQQEYCVCQLMPRLYWYLATGIFCLWRIQFLKSLILTRKLLV